MNNINTSSQLWTAYKQVIAFNMRDDNIRSAKFQFGRNMHMASAYVRATTATVHGKPVQPKVASLFHILAAVEMMRQLKALVSGDAEQEDDVRKLRHFCFREYFMLSGMHLCSDITTKRIVELHLGPNGLATWTMLESLGYSPSENDFWVELDGCLKAQTAEVMESIDGEMFLEAAYA